MRFQCPQCSGIVAVDNSDAGTMVQCGHCSQIVQVPPTRIAAGSVIADFIIQKELGRGGMGVVYLSHQISLDRPAALKVLADNYANNAEFVVGFIKEARAAAKLNHPHIVQAYAVGEDDGIFYFAMENIDGETMKQVLKREQKIPVDRALSIIQQISEALDYAWQEQKLIHRDIKPDNIMLTSNGRAKLADLGLARVAGEIDDSEDDEVMGTPQYISPEHLTGAPMDARSDIYSLGATFYHFITGRFPFEGRTGAEIAQKHLTEPLIPPNEIEPSIPANVSRIIEKMMAKNPIMRYQDTETLIEDLRNARHGKAVTADDYDDTRTKTQHKHPVLKMRKSQAAGDPENTSTGTQTGTVDQHSTSIRLRVTQTSTGFETQTQTGVSGTGVEVRRKRREAARRKMLIGLGVSLVLILVVAGVAVAAGKKKPSGRTPEKSGTETVQKKSPFVRDIDSILDYAAANRGNAEGIWKQCEAFLKGVGLPRTDEEKSALALLEQTYYENDEILAEPVRKAESAKLEEILADRRKTFEREEADRKARELADRKQKELEAKRKREAERHAREVARLVEKTVLELKGEQMYFSARVIQNGLNWQLNRSQSDMDSFQKKLDRLSDDREEKLREAVKPFRKWTDDIKNLLTAAASIQDTALNGDTALEGTQVLYANVIFQIKSIKNGSIVAKSFGDGKLVKFPFEKLSPKQKTVILRKAAGAADCAGQFYFYLLINGHFSEAYRESKDDANSRAMMIALLKAHFALQWKDADEKKRKEMKRKYHGFKELKEVIGG